MGRDREVAAVRQALTRAGGAPQGLVWITGEAGIGKSALAAGIAESIDPFEVFHGVADQVGLRPFGAIVDAFGPGVLPQMQAALGAIVQVPVAVQVSDAVLTVLGDRASQAAKASSNRPARASKPKPARTTAVGSGTVMNVVTAPTLPGPAFVDTVSFVRPGVKPIGS